MSSNYFVNFSSIDNDEKRFHFPQIDKTVADYTDSKDIYLMPEKNLKDRKYFFKEDETGFRNKALLSNSIDSYSESEKSHGVDSSDMSVADNLQSENDFQNKQFFENNDEVSNGKSKYDDDDHAIHLFEDEHGVAHDSHGNIITKLHTDQNIYPHTDLKQSLGTRRHHLRQDSYQPNHEEYFNDEHKNYGKDLEYLYNDGDRQDKSRYDKTSEDNISLQPLSHLDQGESEFSHLKTFLRDKDRDMFSSLFGMDRFNNLGESGSKSRSLDENLRGDVSSLYRTLDSSSENKRRDFETEKIKDGYYENKQFFPTELHHNYGKSNLLKEVSEPPKIEKDLTRENERLGTEGGIRKFELKSEGRQVYNHNNLPTRFYEDGHIVYDSKEIRPEISPEEKPSMDFTQTQSEHAAVTVPVSQKKRIKPTDSEVSPVLVNQGKQFITPMNPDAQAITLFNSMGVTKGQDSLSEVSASKSPMLKIRAIDSLIAAQKSVDEAAKAVLKDTIVGSPNVFPGVRNNVNKKFMFQQMRQRESEQNEMDTVSNQYLKKPGQNEASVATKALRKENKSELEEARHRLANKKIKRRLILGNINLKDT